MCRLFCFLRISDSGSFSSAIKVCLFLLALFAGSAYAQDKYWKGAFDQGTGWGKSGPAACAHAASRGSVNWIYVDAVDNGVGGFHCRGVTKANPSGEPSLQPGSAGLYTCPSYDPYFNYETGRCQSAVPPPPPDKCGVGTNIRDYTYHVGTTSSKTPWTPFTNPAKDNEGCLVKATDVKECHTFPKSATPNQVYCTFGTMRTGGEAPTGTQGPENASVPGEVKPEVSPPMPPDNKGDCPSGTVQAGVSASGMPVCMGTGTNPKNTPAAPPKVETEKTESLPDGSTQTTKTTTTTNSDGSTTVTKVTTVKRPDGSTSTSETKDVGKTPAGAAGKDDSKKDDEKYDLCKQNPTLNICRNSTVAGTCGQVTCTGDAIQCATLRAAAAMECAQRKDQEDLKASPLDAIGRAAANGDTQGLPTPSGAQVFNIQSSLDTQGWLGNGAPFEDVRVMMQGYEIVIPLSKWTSYLLPLRYALMIVASLISFRILGAGILRE